MALLDSMRLPVAQTIPVRIRLKDAFFAYFDEVTGYPDILITTRCKRAVFK